MHQTQQFSSRTIRWVYDYDRVNRKNVFSSSVPGDPQHIIKGFLWDPHIQGHKYNPGWDCLGLSMFYFWLVFLISHKYYDRAPRGLYLFISPHRDCHVVLKQESLGSIWVLPLLLVDINFASQPAVHCCGWILAQRVVNLSRLCYLFIYCGWILSWLCWLSFIVLVGEIKRQMKVTTGFASDTGRLVEDLKMTKMPENNGVVLGKRKVCLIVMFYREKKK